MSENIESIHSYSSTSISESLLNDYTKEKLIKKICILLEALIDLNDEKSLKKGIIKETLFDLKRIPNISLYDYLYHIVKYTKINDTILIRALVYIDRINKKKKFIINYYNIHKLLLISILLAAEHNKDNFVNKKIYSNIGGISLKELQKLEKEFCKYINYGLYINKALFVKYYLNINNDYVFNYINEELKRK